MTRRGRRMMMVEGGRCLMVGWHWMVVMGWQVRGASVMGRGAAMSWRTSRVSGGPGPMRGRPSPMARGAVGGGAAMCRGRVRVQAAVV